MTASKSDQDWAVLLNEYNICKKKLESKREGLRILVKQLEQTHVEKDILNNKVTQLQSELDVFKQLLGNNWVHAEDGLKLENKEENTKIKILNNLLQFSRQENQQIQNDFHNLKQLYNESQRDNQLLRTTLSKSEGRKKIGINDKQGKEHLITQVEEANAKIEALEEELQMRKDDQKEIIEERDLLQKKNLRLNSELNYVLHNDDKRIVDIDNLVLENQYLKEVIKQYKEEKAVALNVASKYKEALQLNQPGGNKKLHYLDLTPSKEDNHHDGLFTKSFNHNMVSDLQRVNKLLTEKVSEKETALKHQRNTNRVLGTRVSQLEKKLKTLEISGLWSHEQRIPRNLREGDFRDAENVDDKNIPPFQNSSAVLNTEKSTKCVLLNSTKDSKDRLDDNFINVQHSASVASSEGLLIDPIDEINISNKTDVLSNVKNETSPDEFPITDELHLSGNLHHGGEKSEIASLSSS